MLALSTLGLRSFIGKKKGFFNNEVQVWEQLLSNISVLNLEKIDVSNTSITTN